MFLQAKTTVAVANPDGGPALLIREGQIIRDTDKLAKLVPGVFVPVSDLVERADAVPGAKRATRPTQN